MNYTLVVYGKKFYFTIDDSIEDDHGHFYYEEAAHSPPVLNCKNTIKYLTNHLTACNDRRNSIDTACDSITVNSDTYNIIKEHALSLQNPFIYWTEEREKEFSKFSFKDMHWKNG